MAFEALLATERLGDRTLSAAPSITNSTTAAVTSVSLLPARATPICPLPWDPASGEKRSTGGTVFVHGWNGFCPPMEHRVPLSMSFFLCSLYLSNNKKEEQS
jgi:hypothetical protein